MFSPKTNYAKIAYDAILFYSEIAEKQNSSQ